jgi:ActR/RegA family two-component response regulator
MNMHRILVLDDDIGVCRVLSRILQDQQYDVYTSQSVVSAAETLAERSFDAYLLDYRLADGTGLQVAEKVRQQGSKAPIILISGYGATDIAAKAITLDIFEVLQKPFTRETICNALERALSQAVRQPRLTISVKKTELPSPKNLADNDYFQCWTGYRRLRSVVITVFVAAMIEVRFFLPPIVIAGSFFAYFLLAMWLANWNCPRCNRSFFRFAFLRSLFGARCFYCQFPKWGITDAGDVVLRPKFPFAWKAGRAKISARP